MTTQDNFVVSRQLIERLYALLLEEVRDGGYDDCELALIADPILYYGRYLDPRTRSYALCNAVSNLTAAIAYLGSGNSSKRLLDLGCGLGMQSILFAACGWDVLGIDYHPESIALCHKRKGYFESQLGQKLSLDFASLDFRNTDPESLGRKFDAVFSMSAFAQIQPLTDTVARISALLGDRGRVFIWEENPGHFYSGLLHFRRRSCPRPASVREELTRNGFQTELLAGGCAVPRQLWWPPAAIGYIAAIDNLLKKSVALSFTYLLGASRTHASRPAQRPSADLLQCQ